MQSLPCPDPIPKPKPNPNPTPNQHPTQAAGHVVGSPPRAAWAGAEVNLASYPKTISNLNPKPSPSPNPNFTLTLPYPQRHLDGALISARISAAISRHLARDRREMRAEHLRLGGGALLGRSPRLSLALALTLAWPGP